MELKLFIKNDKQQSIATLVNFPKELKKIKQIHFRRENTFKRQFPVIFILHGFKGYKEEAHLQALADKMRLKGFIAVRFDARGYGESGGTLEYDYRLSNYFKDLDMIYQKFESWDVVDSNNMYICGHSLGGLASVIYGSGADIKVLDKKQRIENYPESILKSYGYKLDKSKLKPAEVKFKGICAISAPDAVMTAPAISERAKEWKELGYINVDSSKFGKKKIPYEFYEDAIQYNATKFATKINSNKIKSLVIAGDADTNVTLQQSKAIFDAIKANKEFKTFKEMDHFYKNDEKMNKKVTKYIADFFVDIYKNSNQTGINTIA